MSSPTAHSDKLTTGVEGLTVAFERALSASTEAVLNVTRVSFFAALAARRSSFTRCFRSRFSSLLSLRPLCFCMASVRFLVEELSSACESCNTFCGIYCFGIPSALSSMCSRASYCRGVASSSCLFWLPLCSAAWCVFLDLRLPACVPRIAGAFVVLELATLHDSTSHSSRSCGGAA